MKKIAIDFGSTRTKVAYPDGVPIKPKLIELGREARSIVPSLFCIAKDGNVLVGDDAQEAVVTLTQFVEAGFRDGPSPRAERPMSDPP